MKEKQVGRKIFQKIGIEEGKKGKAVKKETENIRGVEEKVKY